MPSDSVKNKNKTMVGPRRKELLPAFLSFLFIKFINTLGLCFLYSSNDLNIGELIIGLIENSLSKFLILQDEI